MTDTKRPTTTTNGTTTTTLNGTTTDTKRTKAPNSTVFVAFVKTVTGSPEVVTAKSQREFERVLSDLEPTEVLWSGRGKAFSVRSRTSIEVVRNTLTTLTTQTTPTQVAQATVGV